MHIENYTITDIRVTLYRKWLIGSSCDHENFLSV